MGRVVGAAAGRDLELEELLELMCGSPPRWSESMFADEDERRAAYEAHHDQLGGMLGFPGNRSWAFWRYEAGIEEPQDKHERILWLAEHGYIEPGEMRMLAEQSAAAKERIGTVAEVATDAEGATFYERVCERQAG